MGPFGCILHSWGSSLTHSFLLIGEITGQDGFSLLSHAALGGGDKGKVKPFFLPYPIHWISDDFLLQLCPRASLLESEIPQRHSYSWIIVKIIFIWGEDDRNCLFFHDNDITLSHTMLLHGKDGCRDKRTYGLSLWYLNVGRATSTTLPTTSLFPLLSHIIRFIEMTLSHNFLFKNLWYSCY